MDFISLITTIFLTAILSWAVERTGDVVLKVIMEKGKCDLPKSDRFLSPTSTHSEQDEDKDK
ncbi:hypothetical protein [Argonema galeatum]|uniref:hypothetical protein n=1 Tax=Argonema galeatum TaxID=2942762 RepID=UPI002013A8D5|nr:hypothetical protein [Argonema galeatum]MCL1467264.1 hypothetical protein [Argonema galeatum A003/A1]